MEFHQLVCVKSVSLSIDLIALFSFLVPLWIFSYNHLNFVPPSTAFGVDAVFSYKFNQQLGICDKDGLALCPGFSTTHSIPVCSTDNMLFDFSRYLFLVMRSAYAFSITFL